MKFFYNCTIFLEMEVTFNFLNKMLHIFFILRKNVKQDKFNRKMIFEVIQDQN